MTDITASIATAIQAKTGGNVEGKIPEWWAEFIGMVLAELHSNGCLIPAGGMALTAEQVEDVRRLLDELASERDGCDTWDLYERLRALFPAAATAEERCRKWTVRVAGGIETGIQCVLPDRHECFHDYVPPIHNYVQPAPAEPAEEETKADGLRKCRKKPVEVEAMQYDGKDWRSIAQWMAAHGVPMGRTASGLLRIHTLEGEMTAGSGDWIIRGVQGEFYPCKPDIFAQTYEPVSSPVVPAPTETGPWQRIEDVPESVYLIKDCEGDKWRRDRKSWEVYSERGFRWHPGFPDRFAPFVAAEEG